MWRPPKEVSLYVAHLCEGLRLVEEREAKPAALRSMLDRSISEGGESTDEEIDMALEAKSVSLAREGF